MLRFRIMLALALAGLSGIQSMSQARPVLKNMLNSRLAEIEITSPLDAQIIQDAGGIFDHYKGPKAHVYLLPEDFEALRVRGFVMAWLPEVREEHGALDQYHENAQIQADFNSYTTAYGNLFSYQSIATTPGGRPMLMAKISDNVGTDEAEIEVKYIGAMHGDELTGLENCMKLIDTLLTGYGTDPVLTELVEDYEIYIMPLMNPDGRDVGTLGQRWNSQGIDLNRDFPDRVWDSVNTVAGRAPETAAVMNFTATRNFVLSANFHGGAMVANYPWDSNYNGTDTFSPTPENALFYHLAYVYSSHSDALFNSPEFPPDGTSNGADWYHVSGGMQDWNYVWMGDKEVTFEISNTKSGPESALDSLWNDNRESMIQYLLEAREGVRGFVTDAESGGPVRANIMLANIPYLTYSTALHGDYFRMLRPGTYALTFSAPGYVSQVVNNIVVVDGTPTLLDVQLTPLPRPEITVTPNALTQAVPLCGTYDVDLTIGNTGELALSWSSAEVPFSTSHYGAPIGGGRWSDSNAPGGPAVSWVDISTIGTAITFASDDQNLGPFALGFTFPFFGQTYSQIRVAANGWLSFTSTATGATSYTNLQLPNNTAPENLLACWWDDLSPQRAGTNVRRWTNNMDSCVISFQNVQSYSGGGVYNFEVILTADGRIMYQYGNMGAARLESATIGWQNSDRTNGGTVIFNGAYMASNMAVSYCPTSALQTIPVSGTVAIGEQSVVTLRLSSCCVPTGPTVATLRLTSNDPVHGTVDVPVTIDAGGLLPPVAVDDLTITPVGADVVLRWSPADNATFYSVWSGTEWPPTLLNCAQLGTTTTTEYTVAATQGGPQYFIIISEQ